MIVFGVTIEVAEDLGGFTFSERLFSLTRIVKGVCKDLPYSNG